VLDRVKQIKFKPGVWDAIQQLECAHFLVFLTACRAGVPLPDARYQEALRARVCGVLAEHGIPPASIHFIVPPGAPGAAIQPLTPAIITATARDHRLDLAHSAIVGDLMCDVKVGHDLGMRTVLICSPDDAPGFEDQDWCEPHHVVETLQEAATCLLAPRRVAPQA
jgi:histidinol phosphatase-like enzyme